MSESAGSEVLLQLIPPTESESADLEVAGGGAGAGGWERRATGTVPAAAY